MVVIVDIVVGNVAIPSDRRSLQLMAMRISEKKDAVVSA